jgi:hypothetical protein
MSYDPAPGQFVNNPDFNDPARALGPPVSGGLFAADNTKVVTLGGWGGSIVLGFDQPVPNLPPGPDNPQGLDFIIFGNAFAVGGNLNRRWAEAGVVEVSADANHNGLADDAWFLIPGSHLLPTAQRISVTYSATNPALPPTNKAWVPSARAGTTWVVSGYALPAGLFAGPVVTNPLGTAVETMGLFGYADFTPAVLLGDLDADNTIDDPTISPEDFYTRPSDPAKSRPTAGSGGGDGFDIAWAVDPATGQPANLAAIDFVRISTGAVGANALFGENSTEISAVAIVRIRDRLDYNRDGFRNLDDLGDFITDYYTTPPLPGGAEPLAPTYSGQAVGFSTPCPDAPDAPAPYAAEAYRLRGYRVGFALEGSEPCPPTGPNLDNLGDYITAFYTP